MKKLIMIVLCFLQIIKANSQTTNAAQVELDRIFQYIDKTKVPTGYLYEYGAAFTVIKDYDGTLNKNNVTHSLMLNLGKVI